MKTPQIPTSLTDWKLPQYWNASIWGGENNLPSDWKTTRALKSLIEKLSRQYYWSIAKKVPEFPFNWILISVSLPVFLALHVVDAFPADYCAVSPNRLVGNAPKSHFAHGRDQAGESPLFHSGYEIVHISVFQTIQTSLLNSWAPLPFCFSHYGVDCVQCSL